MCHQPGHCPYWLLIFVFATFVIAVSASSPYDVVSAVITRSSSVPGAHVNLTGGFTTKSSYLAGDEITISFSRHLISNTSASSCIFNPAVSNTITSFGSSSMVLTLLQPIPADTVLKFECSNLLAGPSASGQVCLCVHSTSDPLASCAVSPSSPITFRNATGDDSADRPFTFALSGIPQFPVFNQLYMGATFTCASASVAGSAVSGRDLFCWGSISSQGSQFSATSPTKICQFFRKHSAAAVSNSLVCIVTVEGSVQCWGPNDRGQLGLGHTAHAPLPLDVPSLIDMGVRGVVSAIAVGAGHVCAIHFQGNMLSCWGLNTDGQVGTGSFASPITQPVSVEGFEENLVEQTVIKVFLGDYHSCTAKKFGSVDLRVWCWGSNSHGQLGNSLYYSPPPKTSSFAQALTVEGINEQGADFASGKFHSCILTITNKILRWGLLLSAHTVETRVIHI